MLNSSRIVFGNSKLFQSKLFSGSLWLAGGRLFVKGGNFFVLLLITRWLTPEQFGLVGISFLALSLVQMLSEFGVQKSVIRSDIEEGPLLETAWTLEVLKGVLIGLSLYLGSDVVNLLFKVQEADELMKVLAFIPLVIGCTNIRLIKFDRDLSFKKIFIIDTIGFMVNSGVTICYIYWFRDPVGMIYGSLGMYMIRLICSYIYFPIIPTFSLEKQSLRQIFDFGGWYFLSGLVSYFVMEGDKFLIGRMYGAASLGLYQVSYKCSNLVIDELKSIISRVLFPVYAAIQHDKVQLSGKISKYFVLIFHLVAPIPLLTFFLSDDFEILFLSESWHGAAELISWLSLAALTRVFTLSFNSILASLGRTKNLFWITSIRLFTFVVFSMLLMIHFGIRGVIGGVILSNIIVFFALLWELRKFIGLSLLELVSLLIPSLLVLVSCSVLAYLVSLFFDTGWWGLLMEVGSFGLGFVFFTLILRRYKFLIADV